MVHENKFARMHIIWQILSDKKQKTKSPTFHLLVGTWSTSCPKNRTYNYLESSGAWPIYVSMANTCLAQRVHPSEIDTIGGNVPAGINHLGSSREALSRIQPTQEHFPRELDER